MKNHIYLLRKKKNIKQYNMAKDLNVSPSYLSKIETGAQKPTKKFKTACAKYLQVSEEDLFNEKDIEKVFPDFSKNLNNKLWALRRIRNIRQYDMAKELKVSTPFLSKVELGLADPPETFKKACSTFFKVPVDKLFFSETNGKGKKK